ncbi:MAG: T9SS type A sorting domain-containing protein [Bacteroidota bacterium]
MKFIFIIVLTIFVLFSHNSNSQTILFSEDFETSPVISFVNAFSGITPDGPSPCGEASRGTTADFNSTNVDFQNTQNSSFFLGVNPQAPCGGFYNALLISDTLDFSGVDSLVFESRYFKSTTLSWGPATLQIVFDNTIDKDTIETEFISFDSWDNTVVALAPEFISPNVIISINMGGGEGVAIDDFEIVGYIHPIFFPQPTNFQFSYDYIMLGDWGICLGTTVMGPAYCSHFSWNTPDTSLTTATFDHYVLYYYDYYLSDTLVVTTTTDTIFEIEQGFIGEMWVTAVYTGPNGESDSSNVIINPDLPISVIENENVSNIDVFYNQNSGQLCFENADKIQIYYIYDIRGNVIVSGKNTSSFIELRDCSKGVYTINILSDDGERFVKKFIIR